MQIKSSCHLAKPIGSYSPKHAERTRLGGESRTEAGNDACRLALSAVPQVVRKQTLDSCQIPLCG